MFFKLTLIRMVNIISDLGLYHKGLYSYFFNFVILHSIYSTK
jgi:hypothetical protein